MLTRPQPRTTFDWGVYANATFAGLSALIPLPFLDSLFEWFFRQRMVRAIARRRGLSLAPVVVYEINRSDESWLQSCALLPVTLTFQLVKRLSKKLLYFMTIKEATDKLSYYWHRAFLLDYMLLERHLDELASAQVARRALEQTLRTTTTSPLLQLAQQTARGTRHVLPSLRRARVGNEDEVIQQKKTLMAQAWENFGDYLEALAGRYDQAYAEALAASQAKQPG